MVYSVLSYLRLTSFKILNDMTFGAIFNSKKKKRLFPFRVKWKRHLVCSWFLCFYCYRLQISHELDILSRATSLLPWRKSNNWFPSKTWLLIRLVFCCSSHSSNTQLRTFKILIFQIKFIFDPLIFVTTTSLLFSFWLKFDSLPWLLL